MEKQVWHRDYVLGSNPGDAACMIRQALFDLAAELEHRRELYREAIHRELITAVHTDSLWEDAEAEAKEEAKHKLRWR